MPWAGWCAPDEGAVYGKRGDGLFYGWTRPAWFAAERDQLDQPQWDTFVGMDFLGLFPSEWSMQLPNGTYPVIIVMGDAASRAQTNTITVNGRQMTDPTPWDGTFTTAAYEEGSFDGYALDVVVTDGRLRLAPVRGQSRNPKLCFIEIGPAGSAITQAQRDRLDAVVQGMTKATAQNHGRTPTVTRFAYGSYVDAVLAFETVERGRTTRRYVHANHLYSPAAVTDVAGVVQERYRYSAYGEQSILTADGRARGRSKVGLGRTFTGYVGDSETGLMYARARMYSPELGRFTARDYADTALPGPEGIYRGGLNGYAGYFAPNSLDPTGHEEEIILPPRPVNYGIVSNVIFKGENPGSDPTKWPKEFWDEINARRDKFYEKKKDALQKKCNDLCMQSGCWADSNMGMLPPSSSDITIIGPGPNGSTLFDLLMVFPCACTCPCELPIKDIDGGGYYV